MNTCLEQGSQKLALQSFLDSKKIVVCCGAGGVGKTTTAAALGVAAAMRGKRVLVLTIDPARRLADALGIPIDSQFPQAVDPARFAGLGVDVPGQLELWMLQPEPVFDEMVRSLSRDEEKAERLFSLNLYQAIRQLVAGMQEYMAGESLYQFYTQGTYDLIVLDTPPSRNAMDFLSAPDRILRFFDARILRVFAPRESRWSLLNRARKLVQRTFDQLAGDGFLGQVQEFVVLFLDIFDVLKVHAETVREVLGSTQSTHFLVTSPDPLAFQEALYFQKLLAERRTPFGGFLLNRSLADHPTQYPSKEEVGAQENLQRALDKLQPWVGREQTLIQEHRALVERLRSLTLEDAFTLATPHLGAGIEDLEGLLRFAGLLLPAETR